MGDAFYARFKPNGSVVLGKDAAKELYVTHDIWRKLPEQVNEVVALFKDMEKQVQPRCDHCKCGMTAQGLGVFECPQCESIYYDPDVAERCN